MVYIGVHTGVENDVFAESETDFRILVGHEN